MLLIWGGCLLGRGGRHTLSGDPFPPNRFSPFRSPGWFTSDYSRCFPYMSWAWEECVADPPGGGAKSSAPLRIVAESRCQLSSRRGFLSGVECL